MGKLLLIDVAVPASQQIVAATAIDVSAIIYDPAIDTRATILEKIAASGLHTISDIGFVQHGSASMSSYTFITDISTGKIYDVENSDPSLSTWSGLLEFYMYLQSSYGVLTIDFISCCIYDDPSWVYILNELENQTGINFRASKNKTGSVVSGGDWIQESDGIDIRSVYFTDAIDAYAHVLYPVYFRQYYEGLDIVPHQVRFFGMGNSEIISMDYTIPRNKRMVSSSQPVVGMTILPTTFNDSFKTLIWGDSINGGDASSVSNKLYYIKSIIGSEGAFAAIKQDGTVFSWGSTGGGTSYTVVRNELYNIQHIASTQKAFAALRSDGRVFTWGNSAYGGDSSSVISQLVNVVGIAATQSAFAALRSDGSVVVWGNAAEGGSTSVSLSDIQYISASSAAFAAIKTDGSVVAWGSSMYGGSIPTEISSQLSGVLYIAATTSAFAAVSLKKIFIWGRSSELDSQQTYHIMDGSYLIINSSKYAFCAATSTNIEIWGHYTGSIVKVDSLDPISTIYSYGQGFVVGRNNDNIEMCVGSDEYVMYNKVGDSTLGGSFIYDRFLEGGPSVNTPIGFSTSGAILIRPNSSNPTYFKTYGDSTKGGSSPTLPASAQSIVIVASNPYAFVMFYTDSQQSTPTIIDTVSSQTLPIGSSYILYAEIIGTAPYSITWTKNSTQVSTTNPYILSSLQLTDSGSYVATVGQSTSQPIVLTIYGPPTITNITGSTHVIRGQSITLTATVSSAVSATYQWQKDGVNIPDATYDVRTILTMSEANNGKYTLIATNPAGSTTSAEVELWVVDLPTISGLTSPVYGVLGETITLLATVGGTTPITYKWYKNGVLQSALTTNTYTITQATRADSTTYRLDVSNIAGTASTSVSVIVGVPPVIRSSPSSLIRIDSGQNLLLSVDVSGDSPLTYQWKKFNITTSQYDDIPNAISTTYSISTVSISDEGLYRLYVSTPYGNTNTSDIEVKIGTLPTIIAYNNTVSCISGDTITLSVQSSSTSTRTYEWTKDGTEVATTETYTIQNINAEQAGVYTLRITNLYGYVEVNISVSVSIQLDKSSLLSNTNTKNIVLSTTISGVEYRGLYSDLSNNKFTFSPGSIFPNIEMSDIRSDISSIACYVSEIVPSSDSSILSIKFGISPYDQTGVKISDLSNQPMTIWLKPPQQISAQSINIYRFETGNNRVFVTTATRYPDGRYLFSLSHFSEYEAVQESVPCFVKGTRVLTTRGFVAVEDLIFDDLIQTDDGRAVTFALASRTVELTTPTSAPYRIAAHAFGPNNPAKDCCLSASHAFQIAPNIWHFPEMAARTVPGVQQYGLGESCTYYHIKLPDYFTDNIVVDGGLVAESFGEDLDTYGHIFIWSDEHKGFRRTDPRV